MPVLSLFQSFSCSCMFFCLRFLLHWADTCIHKDVCARQAIKRQLRLCKSCEPGCKKTNSKFRSPFSVSLLKFFFECICCFASTVKQRELLKRVLQLLTRSCVSSRKISYRPAFKAPSTKSLKPLAREGEGFQAFEAFEGSTKPPSASNSKALKPSSPFEAFKAPFVLLLKALEGED